MKLPYAGEKGCSIIKSLKKHLKKTLPANIEADIIYTGTKLSSQLNNIKDSTLFESSMIWYIIQFAIMTTVMMVTLEKSLDI